MMLRTLLAVVTASAVADAPADQSPISNAKLSTGSAAAGLEPVLRAAIARPSPGWVGYVVPKIPGDGRSCCRDDQGQGCGLEGKRTAAAGSSDRPVKLEGPSHVAILIRAEQGQVSQIRAFSNDCPLDAGGLPLLWLTAVKPPESAAWLLRYASDSGPANRLAEAAVHALALHAGAGAGTALEKLAGSAQASEKVRKSAIFWLANARGRDGYQVVSRLVREDPSPALREHAVFALTQSEEPEAIPTIVRAAREDRSPKVRGQALFWLAQKASRQASAAITAAIEGDPDTEVKKKAVFALTQMPGEEGVPMLVQVARSNPNPAVRKQAMFWLGQSKDPRALKFFEEVLAK